MFAIFDARYLNNQETICEIRSFVKLMMKQNANSYYSVFFFLNEATIINY